METGLVDAALSSQLVHTEGSDLFRVTLHSEMFLFILWVEFWKTAYLHGMRVLCVWVSRERGVQPGWRWQTSWCKSLAAHSDTRHQTSFISKANFITYFWNVSVGTLMRVNYAICVGRRLAANIMYLWILILEMCGCEKLSQFFATYVCWVCVCPR